MLIEWSGPLPLLEAILEPNRMPEGEGVYLWVLEDQGRRLVHYIGRTGHSVRHRLYQHVVRILGGGEWFPRMPIGARFQNRYAPPPQPGARNVEYSRLRQYIDAFPTIAEEALA